MAAANDLVMPKLGLTMTEGVLAEWLVGPGDAVTAGQIIFVVETDKLSTEVEAVGDGQIIELVAEAGATLPVGAVVARWSGDGSTAGADEVTASVSVDEAPPAALQHVKAAFNGARVVATPLARRLARQIGVELDDIAGTGPRGRIKAADVEMAHAQREPAQTPPAAAPPPPSSTRESLPQSTRHAATSLEATVARRLTASKREIPHFYITSEVDIGPVVALRAQLNGDGVLSKLSINHFILAAVARSWAERPEINRVWEDDGFTQFASVDIGMAVDTPRGLFAPVLRDTGAMGIDALARAANQIAARARDGRLGADDLTGGAVAVSNVGMHNVTYLTPVINPGQSAILGVGTIRSVFRPDENQNPVLKQEIGLVLACDHRVFNGVSGAKSLGSIIAYLEAPLRLLRS